MKTLRIDEETLAALERQASTHGLSVEEWLRRSLAGEQSEPITNANSPVNEDWHAHLAKFISLHQPTGANMDDSRESIYD